MTDQARLRAPHGHIELGLFENAHAELKNSNSMLLLFALPGHNRRRAKAFCRESKTFRQVTLLQGIADQQFGQTQARCQVLIVLRVGALAEILFAVIRELKNAFEEISLSRAAIVGEVFAHD
jgi:hypothetical protein